MRVNNTTIVQCSIFLSVLLLSACGGGGGGNSPPTTSAVIGTAGGTVSNFSGAAVVVPAGALATNTTIGIEQSSTGAPALPVGVVAYGQVFAFTPHGTSFATPVTISVPFDPATVPAGPTPVLYKTNATQSAYEVVAGATQNGNVMSGQVTGFSYAVVATPPAEGSLIVKSWDLHVASTSKSTYLANTIHDANGNPPSVPADSVPQIGGVVDFRFGIGQPYSLHPAGLDAGEPNVVAYSNVTGKTFYTQAIAPSHVPFDLDPYESASSTLKQRATFRAVEDHPAMAFHITAVKLESMDYGGNPIGRVACPWMTAVNPSKAELDLCLSEITVANSSFELRASSHVVNGVFYDVGSSVSLTGQHGQWDWGTSRHGITALWNTDNFSANLDVDNDAATGTPSRHAKVELAAPITVNVPMALLKKDDTFTIEITVTSSAGNHIQGESFVSAYFRDPSTATGLDGVSIEFTGLELVAVQTDMPAGLPPLTCPAGPDPAAGQIQFSATGYSAPEGSNEALVSVERVNGTQGEVSVLLQTSNGSALSGSDYQPVTKELRFADGESGSVEVAVPLLNDNIEEPAEALTITLSQPGGCASLGAPAVATLTILDDDTPLPPRVTYTVGGTVTGLAGSGLVLSESLGGGGGVTPNNGAFTFPVALADGSGYDVRIETQPTNPIQICTIANGVGTISGANVSNVAVNCTLPTPNGALDPSFGSDGKVASNIPFVAPTVSARMGMALQADGRILLVGGKTLARFNIDGTADTSFGSAGVVTVPFNGSLFDYAQGVAVQSDGRIVVVGTMSVGGTTADKQDFALARFNADGTLDTSFGTGGIVTTDFNGSQDIARRIIIQADGKLLVAGYSTFVAPTLTENQFALARYNVDGSPDTSFATGLGRTTTGFGGTVNWVEGLTLQRDGKIVVAGINALNGGTPNRNVGVARYLGGETLINGHIVSAGWQDPYFNDPDFSGPLTGGQLVSDLNRGGGEAADVVEQQGIDGQLLVAVNVGKFALATFINLTDPDTGQVYGGYFPAPHLPTVVDFSGQTDQVSAMALQADGKVLLVGRSDIYGANPDMAIARFSPGNESAAIDTTFGNAGKVTVDFFGAFDRAEAVVVQPDGKIVVGGYARNSGKTVFALVRLMP